MNLFHYSQSRAVRLALGVAVLLIAFPVLFKVVFAAKQEVSYGTDLGLSTCSEFLIDNESERLTCTASYNITLGNTGSINQELVTIDLSSVPDERYVGWNVLDIVATNRRPIGPRISNEQLGKTLRFEIQDLEPNRLVKINVLVRGAEFAAQLEDISTSIHAEGSILETHPHTTVALRFLKSVGGIFGI